MSLVSDIITSAFVDLGVIAVGETITTTMQTDAFTRLNQFFGSLSDEGILVPNQVTQSFVLSPGGSSYTLGASGTWPTSGGLRAQRVVAWRAFNQGQAKGGPALPLAEFGSAAAAAQEALAQLYAKALTEGLITAIPAVLGAPIPTLLGADTAYPNINVKVWPPPASPAGSVEVDYWTPMTAFATVGDTVNLPPGWEDLLHFGLAVKLSPQYARASGITQELMANFRDAKAAVASQNNPAGAAPPPPAAQQQQ